MKTKSNPLLIKKVAEIYSWLDSQTKPLTDSDNKCNACGRCCDFEKFDHHLFVTSPELMCLAYYLGPQNIKPMPTSVCPYNTDGKCSIYEHRFAGCRIFQCKADTNFQSQLSELTLKKLKSLCDEFDITYRYTDLPSALNELAS